MDNWRSLSRVDGEVPSPQKEQALPSEPASSSYSSAFSPLVEPGGERRRMHRIQLAVPVTISGLDGNHMFREQTQTANVCEYGGAVLLAAKVKRDQKIAVCNGKTDEEVACRVVLVGRREGDRILVGFEFLEPAPKFWRIIFPSEKSDPAERKRPVAGRQ